jgi:hypothetical protein
MAIGRERQERRERRGFATSRINAQYGSRAPTWKGRPIGARGQEERLGEKLGAVRRQLADEAAMHAQARATLAQAIAAVGQRSPKMRQQRSVRQK